MRALRRAIALVAFITVISLCLREDGHRHAETLTEQLSRTFPYDHSVDLPRNIWQTWRRSPNDPDFDQAYTYPVASWQRRNPDFQHQVFTDIEATALVADLFPRPVSEAYEALPQAVLRADFFRYLILLARSGIYSDIDTTALKPSTRWVPPDARAYFGLVVGIEADLANRTDWNEWYARRLQFCQWTIMGKPGHPVLVDIVASITQQTLQRKARGELHGAGSSGSSILEFTGPGIWTDKLFGFWNRDRTSMRVQRRNSKMTWEHFADLREPKTVGDIVVLPVTSFSPGVRHMGAEGLDHPLAFVKHDFRGTWKHIKS